MSDQMLLARLNALDGHLSETENPISLKNALKWYHVDIEDEVWQAFDNVIRPQVRLLRRSITQTRRNITQTAAPGDEQAKQALSKAWREYAEVYQKSLKIFSECHEFIGGLAFRDKKLDNSICQVADEIINTCASVTSQSRSLTVPAPKEALTKTLGRIVRLRYPDWSIWSLPMVAHEYGHVVDDEAEADIGGQLYSLKQTIGEIADQWIADDAQLREQARKEEEARRAAGEADTDEDGEPAQSLKLWPGKEQYMYFAEEFLADAFATYTMGPAYACAAIHLRLDPAEGVSGSPEQPGDHQRAYVILATLRKMNEEVKIKNPYGGVIDFLDKLWKNSMSQTSPGVSLSAEDMRRLDALVEKIWEPFDILFFRGHYPYQGSNEGWNVAQGWSEQWNEELRDSVGKLSRPKTSGLNMLRDVINAAWLTRIEFPQKSQVIAEAAVGLCQEIIKSKRRAKTKRLPLAAPFNIGRS